MKRRVQEGAKRMIDLAIVLAGAPMAIPLTLVAGILIRLESSGGMFFRQTRIGRDRRPISVLKLRTMVENAESLGAGLYATKNDPRFTRVGRKLRQFSLDELPQLYNVLRGEMSIVGPRPMPPLVVNDHAEDYGEILEVRPGITGLAQVSGRNELPRSRRLELDRRYAREWSIRGDLRILFKTVGVVLSGAGQRNDQGIEDVEK